MWLGLWGIGKGVNGEVQGLGGTFEQGDAAEFLEAFSSGVAGVYEADLVVGGIVSSMGVSENHELRFGPLEFACQIREGVGGVDDVLDEDFPGADLEGFGFSEIGIEVIVTEHRDEGGDLFESGSDFPWADVPGVQDEVDPLEKSGDGGVDESVGIGDEADTEDAAGAGEGEIQKKREKNRGVGPCGSDGFRFRCG